MGLKGLRRKAWAAVAQVLMLIIGLGTIGYIVDQVRRWAP